MQLVIYMNAAMDMEKKGHPDKKVIPAGLFYYRLQDPIIDKGQDLLKELKPDGMVNRSEEVIFHLERDLVGKSDIIPVARNKDGSLSKTSKVLSEEEFELISKFAKEKAVQVGTEILNGDVSVSPYEMNGHTGCDYCPYKGICGFDEKIPGYDYRNFGKLDKEEALLKMREEAATWE